MIRSALYQWAIYNLDIVFFVYGLAFTIMGICIWIQPKKESEFKLARILWLLALFGLIHGLNEFLEMWAIIKVTGSYFQVFRSLVLVVSFVFFFEFGRQLAGILGKWLTFTVVLAVIIGGFISGSFWNSASVCARYFLAFPGGALISLGFVRYYKSEEEKLESLSVKKYFLIAGFACLIYGILGGLVVNPGFFLSLTGIPVQVLRAACAITIAWAVYRILGIFNLEAVERLRMEVAQRKKAQGALQVAYDDLELRVQERTKDLTKANADLKDINIKLTETQDQLIQAEKLNAVGLLASGVAHEVRNPLQIIMQGVNYLQAKVFGKDSDVSETLNMLLESIKRADKVISGLLDFSRVHELSLEPQNINAVLESSIALVKSELKLGRIEIVRELQPYLPLVLADKNKMEQVFINLLLNAAQAMPKGGRIIIRSYAKELDTTRNGIGRREGDNFRLGENAVVVQFEDTGTGIAEENLNRIFDPFFTTKGPRGGTGLGLSVSRNIIHMHKGLIFAQSQVGKGSTMTLILKIAGR